MRAKARKQRFMVVSFRMAAARVRFLCDLR
jgi:hypothetical protein